MKNDTYIVKSGDTLSKIAKTLNTSPEELANINNLSNINRIKVGQKLNLPAKVAVKPNPVGTVLDEVGQVYFKFLDAVEKPIAKMKVWVKAGAEEFEHMTDTYGEIPTVPVKDSNTPVTVSVQKAAGGKKEISKFTADSGQVQTAQHISPKYAVVSNMRHHEGQAPQDKRAAEPPKAGAVNKTRSDKGNPVQEVYAQCTNGDNLKLRIRNEKFRDILLSASKRSGFTPWTVAAIIDAESAPLREYVYLLAKKKDGTPITKAGEPVTKRSAVKLKVGWNENTSANPGSSARGLTQFLDGSWVTMALAKGTYLNAEARKKGWVTEDSSSFKLQDGSFETSKTIKKGKKTRFIPLVEVLCMNNITSWAKSSDKNLQELLDLRNKAEFSIHSGVDYAVLNLNSLNKDKIYKLKLTTLNDGEKAKVAYLCHHLGLTDAINFIQFTIDDKKAKKLLLNQFNVKKLGEAAAAAKAATYLGLKTISDYIEAHRLFIKKFVDANINIKDHMCETSSAKNARSIIDVTLALRK